MKKLIEKWQEADFTSRLLALLFSVILFLNTNGNSLQDRVYNQTYQETIQNIPISLVYDSNDYYVHGYETTATVRLSSANRVQLDTEVNEDTRDFKLVADLTDLEEGTFEVPLRAQNLSSAVSAEVEPLTVTVTIEKRVSQKVEVEPVISSEALEEGFEIDDITVSPLSVEIITGEDTLAAIKRVVAIVDPSKTGDEDFSETVNVEALDANGQPLSILANPNQVTVAVHLKSPKKEVALKASIKGEESPETPTHRITLSKEKVTIMGAKSVLAGIDEIVIPIDVSGVVTTTTRSISIPTGNYRVSPTIIQVTITPISAENSSNSESEEPSRNSSNTPPANSGGDNEHSNTPPETSETKEETPETSESSAESNDVVESSDIAKAIPNEEE
ncbi:YbbR domain-containing protein [Enterococcus sp. PF1-24]|uniref:CdaR family protein n=1 Tax=unclassified Enterococcus TaxID=2608891 RepID=UPI0024740A6F|nr:MULTISPECIES: CdaR family protein [unclassified Enterococcus]MDH6363202.1 YbbR domain-containing protein [Enterococcus sp. PFB1-1]MDH6400296.1 YbbR domain-containing protein [Enterococcus sp. PF1-24]